MCYRRTKMVPAKWTFLIFLVIAAIFSNANGVNLNDKNEKEEFIIQSDDSSEDSVDFCAEVCGEEYGVVCSGDKTDKSKINCACENDNEVFDKTNKECKVDYCKQKCGNVKCDGNKFEEDEVKCICQNKDQDFMEKDKKCTVNYCRQVCGTGENVVCDGNEYERKTQKDCGCEDYEYIYINKKCQKKCSDDEDCFNEGKCKGVEDSKVCRCKSGTSGDMCDVITDCETGKLQKCKGERGNCVYTEGRAVCECPVGKMFHEKLRYCEATCKDDKDCEGYTRKCIDSFCMCRDGYEGEDCSVITGCKDLERKCQNISTNCIFSENAPGKAICECKKGYTYNFGTNQCQDPYCYPENPCKEGECRYDDSVGTGYCVCFGAKYYNYRTHKCEDLDKCLLKKTPCDENELCANGKCKCKYEIKEGQECKSNFCSSNSCFPNSICSEDDETCHCEEGKYYNGVGCQDAPCNFQKFEESCPCPLGMTRENGSDECVPKQDEELCSKDCGYGICVEKNDSQSCRCFNSIADHFKFNDIEKCIIKEKKFCASRIGQFGLMKCKCDGQYTQADDGITCRLKTCEEDGDKMCASKGGECKMNWKKYGGYCECPIGYGPGANGKCTDICSIDKAIKSCAKDDKFCYNSVSDANDLTGVCNCPPTLKMVNGRCSEKARYVYMIRNIPVLKKRYEMKSGINKVTLNSDLIRSMEKTFDDSLFEYGYLYDYRIAGDVVECSAWVNFRRLPSLSEERKLKLVPKQFSNICDDCEENAIVWPPNLLLGEKGLQNVTIDRLQFCSSEVKDILCGKGALCEYEKCTCPDGFKVIEYSIREIADYAIQRCEDIDECATDFHICSENTTCVNTFGDYKCICKDGFKKQKTFYDPENDKSNCSDMCTPSPCIKGKCYIKGKSFDCECQPGYGGPFCNRADATYIKSKKETVLVGSVLGVLLFVLTLAFFYYVIQMKRQSHSGDFEPSSRQNHNEMTERRRM